MRVGVGFELGGVFRGSCVDALSLLEISTSNF